jgi:integrase
MMEDVLYTVIIPEADREPAPRPIWAKPPREEHRIPRTTTLNEVSRCIMASVAMEVPKNPGIKAPAWWRALLIVAWNTGLRRGSLLSMRMSEVDWKNCRLLLAAARMKSRRPLIVHLNAAAMAALRSIRTDRELVFPWPHCKRYFNTCLHRLQDAAGLPKDRHFDLPTIRKTFTTILWEINPGAAQYACGHTMSDVTRKHYVDGGDLVARALDQLPQLETFPSKVGPEDNAAA